MAQKGCSDPGIMENNFQMQKTFICFLYLFSRVILKTFQERLSRFPLIFIGHKHVTLPHVNLSVEKQEEATMIDINQT